MKWIFQNYIIMKLDLRYEYMELYSLVFKSGTLKFGNIIKLDYFVDQIYIWNL